MFKCIHHVYAKHVEQLQLLLLQEAKTEGDISKPEIAYTHKLFLTIQLISNHLNTLNQSTN